jgi:hypothetical protein
MIVYINYTNNTNNYPIFKNRMGRTSLVSNTSTSLQTTLAAAAHPAEGGANIEQCKVSDIPSRNSETNNFQNRRAEFQFNSIQFFIIYVPCQQPQGQLQTQHSVDKSNYIMDKQQ